MPELKLGQREEIVLTTITRQEVIDKIEDLIGSIKYCLEDEYLYSDILDEIKVYVWALKSIDDIYPLDRAIDIQEQFDKLESRMPFITGEEVKESVLLNDLLDVLHYPIRRINN